MKRLIIAFWILLINVGMMAKTVDKEHKEKWENGTCTFVKVTTIKRKTETGTYSTTDLCDPDEMYVDPGCTPCAQGLSNCCRNGLDKCYFYKSSCATEYPPPTGVSPTPEPDIKPTPSTTTEASTTPVTAPTVETPKVDTTTSSTTTTKAPSPSSPVETTLGPTVNPVTTTWPNDEVILIVILVVIVAICLFLLACLCRNKRYKCMEGLKARLQANENNTEDSLQSSDPGEIVEMLGNDRTTPDDGTYTAGSV